MASPVPTPTDGAQLRALTPVFLGRFFESESSGGTTDITHAFIWLVAVLATPGIFLPLYHTESRWALIAARDGVAQARLSALADKMLYLDLTLVALGILSAIVWHTLVVNRRDALVLNGLPIRPRTIVTAKLAALGIYASVISVGMHGIAAVLYGGFLGGLESPSAVGRDVGAHFVASTALSLWVFVTIAALQSTCLLAFGPRVFGRWSVALQMLIVSAVMGMLVVLPLAASSAGLAMTGGGAGAWIEFVPAFWFLGLEEALSGSPLARVPDLAARALVACGVSLVLLLATYPLACVRVLRSAVQDPPRRGAPISRRLAARFTEWLAPEPHIRAAVQFFLATMSRVHAHRLVLSIAAGAGLAGTVTALLVAWPTIAMKPPSPSAVALAAAPHYLIFALCLGLRLAASLPAELPARWPFHAAPSPPLTGRHAVRRVMLAFGVALPLMLFVPVWAACWGPRLALTHAAGTFATGAALVELHLWTFGEIPGTRQPAPAGSGYTSRGIALVLGLFFFAYDLPSMQVILDGVPLGPPIVVAVLLTAWWAIRRAAEEMSRVDALTDGDDGLVMLDLTITPAPPARVIVGSGDRAERG